MELTAIDLYRYTLPLTAPLALKGAPLHERTGFLIRMEDAAGHIGWGEASLLPRFSRESADEVSAQLQEMRRVLVEQALTGNPIDPDGAFARLLDQKAWAASVRFGIEGAAWHLFAEATNASLPEVLCDKASDIVSLNGLLLGSNEDILERTRQMQEAGYRAVKLKVGRQAVASDVALVRAVSAVLGENVALRLDANRLWTLDEAVTFAEGISNIPIAYIEEPLCHPAQLPMLATQTGLPIALDESLVGMPVAALQDHDYASAIVLKPTVLGGVIHTLRMVRMAQSLGMKPVLSAAFETGIGLRTLVALAACLGDTPVGLDTYRWLADDVLDPRLTWAGPEIDVAALMQTPRRVHFRHLEPFHS